MLAQFLLHHPIVFVQEVNAIASLMMHHSAFLLFSQSLHLRVNRVGAHNEARDIVCLTQACKIADIDQRGGVLENSGEMVGWGTQGTQRGTRAQENSEGTQGTH